MHELSKYDVVCLERGDINYLEYVADLLSSGSVPSESELDNISKALCGIVRSATDLVKL
jgi:hypothetical protein